jgi:predicted TPR repeat methyltransferase
VNRSSITEQVAAYYSGKVRQYGDTPQGVDWKSEESQRLRFEQVLRVCGDERSFSLLDFGCGWAGLLDHLISRGLAPRYQGFDVSAEMIEHARARHASNTRASFTADEGELTRADYVVASGIFNVKLDTPDEVWSAYVLETLGRLNELATRGFAFNALSVYSDPEKRRNDLHYADPLALFDHCKRRFSARVALLHDYPLWEFTILVRREER